MTKKNSVTPEMSQLHRTLTSPALFFKGRDGDPRLGESISSVALREEDSLLQNSRQPVVLWGCPDDTGVVLNRGRAGAAGGPDSIRQFFFKMTQPSDGWKNISLLDFGNLIPGESIDETQSRTREITRMIGRANATLIALGGGHDFAAPNFTGYFEGQKLSAGKSKAKKLGLINVDPHLDVRELENGLPHSGTPFRQILESGLLAGDNFVEFGARSNRNASAHFDYCRSHRVVIRTLEQLREKSKPIEKQFQKELENLSARADSLAVTFDMDSCSEAEGVSAAPVLGFTAWELCRMAQIAGETKMVDYFEIAEVAPALEPTLRTSRIAAEMLYFFLRGRVNAKSLSK